eukprot:6195785-Pleurochrysis_carterae.AAC.2
MILPFRLYARENLHDLVSGCKEAFVPSRQEMHKSPTAHMTRQDQLYLIAVLDMIRIGVGTCSRQGWMNAFLRYLCYSQTYLRLSVHHRLPRAAADERELVDHPRGRELRCTIDESRTRCALCFDVRNMH